jgi:hypothetical protein
MKKFACRVVVLGCLLLPSFAPARADDIVVGVNLVNEPDRLTPQQQDTIPDSMRGLILYTWEGDFREDSDHPDRYSAFMCGAVTKSGRLPIAPMEQTMERN